MALDLLAKIGRAPELVVDVNAPAFAGDSIWEGAKLVKPDDVPAAVRSSHLLAVTIANLPFEELERELSRQGWADIVPFYDITEAYRDVHPLGNGWVLDEIGDEDVESTLEVLDKWSDDVSRAHHLQFMAWHRSGTDWIFADAPVNTQDRYLIPEVRGALGGDQAFLDVGAHRGETTERVCALQGIAVRHAWMIEPDPVNAAEAERVMRRLRTERRIPSELFGCAVSRQSSRERFFSGLGYASQLSPIGRDMADVTTIDDLDVAPTFVKLHLEGHELDALMGAKGMLQTYRPLVAATAYHNELGVWRLPRWLMDQLPDYTYHFRLHSWCGTGAVVYCVPRASS